MTELSGQEDKDGDLREMTDPEFFAYWAVVRNRLILTPTTSTEHREIKRRYDIVLAEYRRRVNGGMTRTA